jgi:hypothetical protein
MKLRFKPFLIVVIACFYTYPAGLFSDDFSDTAASVSNWVFSSSLAHTLSNGTLTITNSSNAYTYFATHSMSSKASTFTITAKIASTANAGMGVCLDDSYNGIWVQIASGQTVIVYKYRSGTTVLSQNVNSFISTTENILKISKQDSTVNIFCNGRYITTVYVSDTGMIKGGNIALIMFPGSSAAFDDIIMTDDYITGAEITSFSDDFSDGSLDGWYLSTHTGTESVSGGQMLLANSSGQYGMPFVTGDFDNASYKVVAQFKGGSGLYGIALVFPETDASGTIYKSYIFTIDSARCYAIRHPDSSSTIVLSSAMSYIHGSTGDCRDTLELLRFGNRYKFLINGNTARDSLPLYNSGTVGLAGVYAYGASVGFDDFVAGGDSTGAYCPVIYNVRKSGKSEYGTSVSGLYGNGYILFDVRGRIIKKFNGYPSGSFGLPAGAYFLRNTVKGKKTEISNIILTR